MRRGRKTILLWTCWATWLLAGELGAKTNGWSPPQSPPPRNDIRMGNRVATPPCATESFFMPISIVRRQRGRIRYSFRETPTAPSIHPSLTDPSISRAGATCLCTRMYGEDTSPKGGGSPSETTSRMVNPNTGVPFGMSYKIMIVRQIYHEEASPSHVLLPVIPSKKGRSVQ